MKIHFKGKEYDLSKADDVSAFTARLDEIEAASATVAAAVATAHTERDQALARADASDAALKKAETDFASRLDSGIAARVDLHTSATRVLGGDYDPKAKTDREIMIDVVRADDENFTGKDPAGAERSADYVRARFDAVVEKDVRVDSIGNAPRVARQVREGATTRTDGVPDVEKSHAEMVEANRNAWQKPAPGAN